MWSYRPVSIGQVKNNTINMVQVFTVMAVLWLLHKAGFQWWKFLKAFISVCIVAFLVMCFFMVVGVLSSCAGDNTRPTQTIQVPNPIDTTEDYSYLESDSMMYGDGKDSMWFEIERQKFLDSLFLIDLQEMYGINSLEEYYEKHDSLILGDKYDEYYGE